MKRALAASALLFSLASMASAQASHLIRKGNVLAWSIANGQRGQLKVVVAEGPYFEVEQTNDQNRGAGIVRLQGAILEEGRKVVLINGGPWKEVWEGRVAGNEITGMLGVGASGLGFRITEDRPPVFSTAPFLPGRTLKWGSDAAGGQHGTFFVVSTKGPWFYLEQQNARNPGAGSTKLEGEFKDGRIFIYNRQWNETWVGTFDGGQVVGRINDRYAFHISE